MEGVRWTRILSGGSIVEDFQWREGALWMELMGVLATCTYIIPHV